MQSNGGMLLVAYEYFQETNNLLIKFSLYSIISSNALDGNYGIKLPLTSSFGNHDWNKGIIGIW